MPFRPHRWFAKPRRRETNRDAMNGNRNEDGGHRARRRRFPRFWSAAVATVALAAATVVPQAVLADDHEPWRDEIDFEINEPIPGRRIFVEGLTVSGDRADVILHAATNTDLRVRAFGGPQGTSLRFWGLASLEEGERVNYTLPLHGPVPSFTFSWEDGTGQAGAFTVEHDWIPHPLPEVEGELCDLRMTSLGWSPGAVSGVVESGCVSTIEHPVELETVAGHESVAGTALVDAGVTAITGTVSASTGGSTASVPLVAGGEASFRLSVPTGKAVHAVSVDVGLEASLSIPLPPLTVLTHHPARVEQVTRTVHLHRPGASDHDSETVTVTHDDGSTSSATATAHAHVPSATIARDVTVDVQHPEHVRAEVVERSPISQTRQESLALASAIGTDDSFKVLVVPEPEPEDPPAEQTPGGDLSDWFRRLGWEWPW